MTGVTRIPTGRREARDGIEQVAFERTFRAPVGDVWAAITEPERLVRWIGTWTGDPADGEVAFRMTAEGADVPAEVYVIEACDEPHRLVVVTGDGAAAWRLTLLLDEAGGVTTLTFAQAMSDPELAASVGPGWDYYLDRLVAAESGTDVASVVWEDYYPAQADHYRGLFA